MNIESIRPAMKRKTSTWLMIWGILIFVCGILAIAFPATFPAGIAIVLGCLILVAGIAHVIFAFHSRSIGGFLWHILLGSLYCIIALSLLANPLLGVVSLALLLALFLLIEGVLELGLYFCIRRLQHSVWVSVDGIGTLILGILMVTKWPPYSPEILAQIWSRFRSFWNLRRSHIENPHARNAREFAIGGKRKSARTRKI